MAGKDMMMVEGEENKHTTCRYITGQHNMDLLWIYALRKEMIGEMFLM